MTLEAYPLTWPVGQPRTADRQRVTSAFKVSFTRSRDELLNELKLLGARHVVLSSNAPVRRDGIPYADFAEPHDPGIAVYFDRFVALSGWTAVNGKGAWKPFTIACDTYRKLVWNVRAVGMTVAALRTIERHGSSAMLEQAFTGFAALPPATNGERPWWEVLGLDELATNEEIRAKWASLAAVHHPDVGGSHERMSEINRAFERAKEARNGHV